MAAIYIFELLIIGCLIHGGFSDQTKYNNVNLTYTIWVGPEILETHQQNVTIAEKSTFYETMRKAEIDDQSLEFEATEHPIYGHYIISVAGHSENPQQYLYWMLYVLDELPNVQAPPDDSYLSEYGVDSLIVENNKDYLLWLRQVKPIE